VHKGILSSFQVRFTSGRMASVGQGLPACRFRIRMGRPSSSHAICRKLKWMPYLWNRLGVKGSRENCQGQALEQGRTRHSTEVSDLARNRLGVKGSENCRGEHWKRSREGFAAFLRL